jgi:capsular exopolysaccharide synthesis family protein
MEEALQPAKNELASLGIKDLFYKYIRFLPLFIISVALSLFVAFIFLRYATLIYRSTGTMIIQDDKTNTGSNDKLDQIFTSDNKKNIQNEIEYLQSRQMMSRVVRALNLNYSYIAKGNIKELDIYKQSPFNLEPMEISDSSGFTFRVDFQNEHSFKINGDGPFAFGQVFKNDAGVFRLIRNPAIPIGGQYYVSWKPTSTVASMLASTLLVAPKQNTGILILTHESTSAQLSADIINELMHQYQEATKEDKNQTNQNRLDFIDRELDTVSKQVDSINRRMVMLVKRYNLIDPATQSTNYFNRVEQSSKEVQDLRQQLNSAYQIEDYMRNRQNNVTPVPSSLGLADPTLNSLVTAYNQAQLEKKALLEYTPPGNPSIQKRNEVIEKLRLNILENLKNIKGAYHSVIGGLQGNIQAINSQISMFPEKQQMLDEVKRQLEGKLVIFNSLLIKREESAIALASTISNIKVLQDAGVNTTPVKPNPRNTKILAILVGLVLPALFIFILELLNDKVTTRYDIERLTKAAILGEVGHSFGKNNLVVTNNNRSVVAEQFRIIRSNLQYILHNINKPVILVTSSFSGEGKSFVSTNIGAVLGLAGKKTIILEFDIRKPKILAHLNIAKRPGLTNYLLGKVNIENLPIPVEGSENLFVLPCGPVPPNPAELLLDPKLNDLFAYLRENFDVVIMDTAPVGMVSDAMTLSRYADCTLYIVRQGHTYKKQIGLIDEFYREQKLPKISIVLNDVKLRTGYGYYGYGRYGYGHGYGSGYFEDDAPPPGLLTKWFGWLDIKRWNNGKTRRKTKV